MKLDPAHSVVQLDQTSPGANGVHVSNFPTDGSGNLKTAIQGTANVAGTVNVGNLPTDANGNLLTAPQGTQNVNITGGSITSTAPIATNSSGVFATQGPNSTEDYLVNPTIIASLVTVSSDRAIRVTFTGPATPPGASLDLFAGGGGTTVVPLAERIRIHDFQVVCTDPIASCRFDVSIVGD